MDLLTQHEIGQVINQMHPVKKREKYRNNALIVLADKIRVSIRAKYSANRLYSLREFAVKFNLQEVKTIIRLAIQHQARITWSHILYSLSIENSKKRIGLLHRILSSRATAEDLMRLKIAYSGSKSLGGKKLRIPHTLQETLEQMIEHTHAWVDRCQKVWLDDDSPLKCISKKSSVGKRTVRLDLVSPAADLLKDMIRLAERGIRHLS